jgi:hypothetical protein
MTPRNVLSGLDRLKEIVWPQCEREISVSARLIPFRREAEADWQMGFSEIALLGRVGASRSE